MTKLEIISIENAQMQAIAKKVDTNSDGVLKDEEFSLFAQEATKAGFDYNTISETLNLNAFQRWLYNVDKVCTDGKDDGKLGIGETLEHVGKGLAGLVKTLINNPIATGLGIAAGVGLTALTGGAILPILTATGGVIGAGLVGIGGYKAATAKTDAEAKQAWETLGNGVFALGASVVSAKSSLNAASKGGVTSAQGAKDMSTTKAFLQTFKTLPEAVKMSGVNAKANAITWVTGTVQPNSNIGRIQEQAITKAKDLVDQGMHWKCSSGMNDQKASIIEQAGVKITEPKQVGYHNNFYRDEFNGEIYRITATRGDKSIDIECTNSGGFNIHDIFDIKILEALANGQL